MKKIFCCIVSVFLIFILCCCTGQAAVNSATSNSTGQIGASSQSLKGVELLNTLSNNMTGTEEAAFNATYKSAYNKFSFDFFKTVTAQKGNENVCLSPLSAYMAFSLCFAGSDNLTEEEFNTSFGLSKEQAAEFCKALYIRFMQREYFDENTKVNIANSVWINDAYAQYVKSAYLEKATNSFNAPIYKADFSNENTVAAINKWCSDNTDGFIDKIIEELAPDGVMALINALLVEAQWRTQYTDTYKSTFVNKDISEKQVDYLCDTLSSFYQAEDAKAFKLELCDGFSFVGIRPNDGVSIDDYCNGLTSARINALLSNEVNGYKVNTRVPEFKNDFEIELKIPMTTLGLNSAFNSASADFKQIAEIPGDNIYIEKAIQKTHFELDKNGIKAAAVTYILIVPGAAIEEPQPEINIYLDHPFVYMLMDDSTGLPLFIGTVKTL